MSTIEFTDRSAAARAAPATRALVNAAMTTRSAPSIVGTRPWRWRIGAEVAELRSDQRHRMRATDPDGRLLTVSGGMALHHMRTALRGTGAEVDVSRLPDGADPDLLARLRVVDVGTPRPDAVRLLRAMTLRRTDRQQPVLPLPAATLDLLRVAAEEQGAHLRLLDPVDLAALTQAADGTGVDGSAASVVLCADADTADAWLAAGEALSAVLLVAALQRLAVSPIPVIGEVPATRRRVRELLGGFGYPAVAIRVGVPSDPPCPRPWEPTPRSP
jgi:hypothetical protein